MILKSDRNQHVVGNSRSQLPCVVTFLVIICGLMISLAPYVTHTDDDFCFLRDIRSQDRLIDYLRFWWNNWSGRWAGTLMRFMYFSQVGFQAASWLAIVLMICAASACLAIGRSLYGPGSYGIGAGLAAATLFFLVSGPEMFYWAAAGFDYTAGYLFIGLLVWCCAIVAENSPSRRWLVAGAGAVCGVVACGFSEIQAIVPPAMAGGFLWFRSRRRVESWVIFLSASAGAAINLLAPGARRRRDDLEFELELAGWLVDTLVYGLRLVLPTVLILVLLSNHPRIWADIIALGSIARERLGEIGSRALALGVLGYPFAVSASVSWSLTAAGPGRTRNFALLALIVCWPVVLVALLRGLAWLPTLRARVRGTMTAVGLLVVLSMNIPGYVQDRFAGRAARAMSVAVEQERILSQTPRSGEALLPFVTDVPHAIQINHISENPSDWVNVCIAGAWQVGSVKRVE